jgi:hypothetical protein
MLRAEDGYIVASPKDKLTSELRAELRRHKPELLELLMWDEEAAYRLLKDAWAYIAEFHEGAGSPDFDAEPIREAKDKVDEAYEQSDAQHFQVCPATVGRGECHGLRGCRG